MIVAVIGLGYVGLPLAVRLAKSKSHAEVVGLDVSADRVLAIRRGEAPVSNVNALLLKEVIDSKALVAKVPDTVGADEVDATIICVPTPLTAQRQPDMSYVWSAADVAQRITRPNGLIVLESTVYPGATREMAQRLTATRRDKRHSFAFSPERENPGMQYDMAQVPKLVGGLDPASTERAGALYKGIYRDVVPVSSAEVAESAKLLENIYRSVNIALVNEMKLALDRMGVDVWEVIAAAKTKPFGFQAFYPGPGLGGHCIPLDPFYFAWKARESNATTRFIELAGEINTAMPEHVARRVQDALNETKRPLRDASVLLLGAAYKANIEDDRESPTYRIAELLRAQGALVSICDPLVKREDMVPLDPSDWGRYDAVVLVTEHAVFLQPRIFQNARLVVDCRGALRGLNLGGFARVVGA